MVKLFRIVNMTLITVEVGGEQVEERDGQVEEGPHQLRHQRGPGLGLRVRVEQDSQQ